MKQFNDYLKCNIANRFTLTGYLALPVDLSLEIARQITLYGNSKLLIAESLLLGYGFGALFLTNFGKFTVISYRVSAKSIQKHKKVTSRLARKYGAKYCFRKGLELAIKESHLEKILSKDK